MVPNAGNAKVVAAALAERAGSAKKADSTSTVQDASAETSLIAVQGPKRRGHPADAWSQPSSTTWSPG